MALKDKWKKTGKNTGKAFANLGKSIGKTMKMVVTDDNPVEENGRTELSNSWRETGYSFNEMGEAWEEAAEGTVDKILNEEKMDVLLCDASFNATIKTYIDHPYMNTASINLEQYGFSKIAIETKSELGKEIFRLIKDYYLHYYYSKGIDQGDNGIYERSEEGDYEIKLVSDKFVIFENKVVGYLYALDIFVLFVNNFKYHIDTGEEPYFDEKTYIIEKNVK